MIWFIQKGLFVIFCIFCEAGIILEAREMASTKGVAIDIIEAPLGKEVCVQGWLSNIFNEW